MRYFVCLSLLTSAVAANDAWVIRPKRQAAPVWVVTTREEAKPVAPATISEPPATIITESTGSCASGTCSQPMTGQASRGIFRRRR